MARLSRLLMALPSVSIMWTVKKVVAVTVILVTSGLAGLLVWRLTDRPPDAGGPEAARRSAAAQPSPSSSQKPFTVLIDCVSRNDFCNFGADTYEMIDVNSGDILEVGRVIRVGPFIHLWK